MLEQFYHRPIAKVRTDFMAKSIAGTASLFLKLMELTSKELQEKLI